MNAKRKRGTLNTLARFGWLAWGAVVACGGVHPDIGGGGTRGAETGAGESSDGGGSSEATSAGDSGSSEGGGGVRPCPGPATFSDPAPLSIGATNLVMLADVNGDGLDDILARWGTRRAVFVNDGAGGFGSEPDDVVDGSYVAVAQLDDDGIVDLVTCDEVGGPRSFVGNGDGTFEMVTQLEPRSARGPVVAGDFDGDGHADAVVALRWELRMLKGDGTGALIDWYSSLLDASGDLENVIGGDLDGNGVMDLVGVHAPGGFGGYGPGRVSTIQNTGEGKFFVAHEYGGELEDGSCYDYGVVGDIDNDGVLDVAVAAGYGGDGCSRWWYGAGNGQLEGGEVYSYSSTPAIADVDGDGLNDLALIAGAEPPRAITMVTSRPSCSRASLEPPAHLHTLAAGNLNGDDVADFIATDETAKAWRVLSE